MVGYTFQKLTCIKFFVDIICLWLCSHIFYILTLNVTQIFQGEIKVPHTLKSQSRLAKLSISLNKLV
jgi:hypothetical protein